MAGPPTIVTGRRLRVRLLGISARTRGPTTANDVGGDDDRTYLGRESEFTA